MENKILKVIEEGEKDFEKKFPNEQTVYLDEENNNVTLFNPAVDANDIKDWHKQQQTKLLKAMSFEFKILIANEISICRQENSRTSRLTSLAVKFTQQINQALNETNKS